MGVSGWGGKCLLSGAGNLQEQKCCWAEKPLNEIVQQQLLPPLQVGLLALCHCLSWGFCFLPLFLRLPKIACGMQMRGNAWEGRRCVCCHPAVHFRLWPSPERLCSPPRCRGGQFSSPRGKFEGRQYIDFSLTVGPLCHFLGCGIYSL